MMNDPARPNPAEPRYRAAVLGDGSVLPIVETIGRRQIREIDPVSSEGRSLLSGGHVTLWYEDGARTDTLPIDDVLDRLLDLTARRRDALPHLKSWTSPHDRTLKSIRRMRKILAPRP